MGSMLNIPSRMEGPEQKTIIGKPEITVSSKGIANGKSVYLNDGADFGPDTKLGATTKGLYGPPFTTTNGIQEMFDSAYGNSDIDPGTSLRKWMPMTMLSGLYIVNSKIKPLIDNSHSAKISLKSDGAVIALGINDYCFEFLTPVNSSHIEFPIIYNNIGASQTTGAIHLSEMINSYLSFEEILNFSATGCIGVFIDQTNSPAQGFFNNEIHLNFCNNNYNSLKINVLDHATNANGFGGNDIFIRQINGGTSDQIIINGTSVTPGNANANTFFNTIIENVAAGKYGIIDNDGGNTIFINELEFNINVSANATLYDSIYVPSLYSASISNLSGKCRLFMSNPQGFAITTPALPAAVGSTDAVTNTFPFAVRVFQAGESGTHIIDINGNDVLLPADPAEVTLDPGDKIYYATTVATSWKWYGC